jgi:uncharacterized protein YfiM (DUF2279 family)
MKFVLAFALSFGGRDDATDRWFGADKFKHFFASAFVQSVSYTSLRALDVSHGAAMTGASVTTAAVAVGKEIRDEQRGTGFSGRDLVWDAAGAASAALLLDRTRR